MSSPAKKIRDKQDKELIRKITGKIPKHRCPICHRFTLWINTKEEKQQCLMCKVIKQSKIKEGEKRDDSN